MSVRARRSRVQRAERHGQCEHCGAPILRAVMGLHQQPVQLDPFTLASGTLELEPDGFARFIAPARRDPKHALFVPDSERYQSHRVTCTANERTCADETREFIADVDRRLNGGRSIFASLDEQRA